MQAQRQRVPQVVAVRRKQVQRNREEAAQQMALPILADQPIHAADSAAQLEVILVGDDVAVEAELETPRRQRQVGGRQHQPQNGISSPAGLQLLYCSLWTTWHKLD